MSDADGSAIICIGFGMICGWFMAIFVWWLSERKAKEQA